MSLSEKFAVVSLFRAVVPWLVSWLVVAFQVACGGAVVGWLIWCDTAMVFASPFGWLLVSGKFVVASLFGAVVGVVVRCWFASDLPWLVR